MIFNKIADVFSPFFLVGFVDLSQNGCSFLIQNGSSIKSYNAFFSVTLIRKKYHFHTLGIVSQELIFYNQISLLKFMRFLCFSVNNGLRAKKISKEANQVCCYGISLLGTDELIDMGFKLLNQINSNFYLYKKNCNTIIQINTATKETCTMWYRKDEHFNQQCHAIRQ